MPSKSIIDRLKHYKDQIQKLEDEAKSKGALRRQDWWRLSYYKNPYLIEATTQGLNKRYQDISGNLVELYQSGKIGPRTGQEGERWLSLASHVQEELFTRNLIMRRADDDIHLPIPTFPSEPPGLRILGGQPLPSNPYLVKIGKQTHMRNMFEKGEIRICPASSYADPLLTTAVRDNELESTAQYPLSDINRTSLGRSVAHKFDPTRSGEITVRKKIPNFYAYCLAHQYDHRLLDDFHGDALVLVKDPKQFIGKIVDEVKSKDPALLPRVNLVSYYDPYFVEDWNAANDGFLKHFRYAYQREFRICWNTTVGATHLFHPFFIDIGNMSSYAQLLTL